MTGKKTQEIKDQIVKNKDDADREDKLAPKSLPNPNKQIKMISSKSLPSKHKAMNQALELLVQDETLGNRAMPNFSRGPEIEITTMQDVEMMKAMLAQLKIHIPT